MNILPIIYWNGASNLPLIIWPLSLNEIRAHGGPISEKALG